MKKQKEGKIIMRSTQYDSQIVLNRSYKLFNKGGLNNLKIRAVAHACHCSVMPIYYSFKSQQGLHHAVLKKLLIVLKGI